MRRRVAELAMPSGLALTRLCSFALQTTRGDMWVTFSIAFPRAISDEQKQQLRELFGGNDEWQRKDEL